MGSVRYITNKQASELLGVSASSMRVYAQNMEAAGYTFKKIDNSRQFSEYDLQIIAEALQRHKSVGGTVKDAINYVVVKDRDGAEAAENIKPVTEETSPALTASFTAALGNKIDKSIDAGIERILQALDGQQSGSSDTEALEKENALLKGANEQQRATIARLERQIEAVKRMNSWQFRKWKKEN